MLSLMQLEKAYMDTDDRALEIEKTISLLQIAPLQLANFLQLKPDELAQRLNLTPEQLAQRLNLTTEQLAKLSTAKPTGKCSFTLDEDLFEQDFPGHYCRKIKSVAVTIPAVVGPYQNIRATLTQTVNRVRDDSGKLAADFRKQQIAISRGVNDNGLFELNFRDERYLPFEGTGAVSEWILEIRPDNKTPTGDNDRILDNSISDVVIHLRYTARDRGEPIGT
jgi:hypothetical protein